MIGVRAALVCTVLALGCGGSSTPAVQPEVSGDGGGKATGEADAAVAAEQPCCCRHPEFADDPMGEQVVLLCHDMLTPSECAETGNGDYGAGECEETEGGECVEGCHY